MKKTLILTLLIIVGCSPAYKVRTLQDKFRAHTINRTYANRLPGTGTLLRMNVELNALRHTDKNGKASYYLTVDYADDDLLFTGEEDSLILIIDGKRIAYAGDRSFASQYVNLFGKTMYVETAYYPVNRRDLDRISLAEELVEVKIKGRESTIELYMSDLNILNFTKFLWEY